jgi:hypothetical protein
MKLLLVWDVPNVGLRGLASAQTRSSAHERAAAELALKRGNDIKGSLDCQGDFLSLLAAHKWSAAFHPFVRLIAEGIPLPMHSSIGWTL